jgi:hypothetical protein
MADDIIQNGETSYYRTLITQYDKAFAKWQTRSKKIVKRYLDDRTESQVNLLRYNILWSNVETLKPAIYAQTPKPEVERRFLDKDPVGRKAAEAIERCLRFFMATTAFGSCMRQSRDDYLLVGRGISWVRYMPTFKDIEKGETSDTEAPKDAQLTDDAPPAQEVVSEQVVADYVHYRDFGHNVARTWEEVTVVWRMVYMTREQMKVRGFADWNKVPLDYVDKELKEQATDDGKKATVYEVWDKAKRRVCWIAKSWPTYLDDVSDPLGLDHFFPCSRPIYATLSNDSLVPSADYVEYQDQAEEIDQITNRIGMLSKAIKVAGVFDASQPAIVRLLSEGVQNQLLPVDSWAAMAEKGGLEGAISWLPMKEIAETLIMLYEAREKVKQDLYEITGMSDIIRGATKASETATAQQIKSNFVTLRLSEKQREMQRFARNTVEIMGNVICRHFGLETIKQISGMQLLTEAEKQAIQAAQAAQGSPHGVPSPSPGSPGSGPHIPPSPGQPAQALPGSTPGLPPEIQELLQEPSWEQVYQLIQDNPDRSFRIGIETDSTVQADQQQEQEAATQFVTAIGGFLQQAQEAAGNPAIVPFLGEMLAWACRRWPISRDLQGAIDTMTEKLAKMAEQPQQPKPDPEMAKVQQDGQIKQAQMQQDGQLAAQKMQSEAQAEQVKAQGQMQLEHAKAQLQLQIERERMAMEDQREREHFQMQMAADKAKADLDARTKIEIAEIGAKAAITAAQEKAAAAAANGDTPSESKAA